jgi:pimeloyl-ACP methyl ester carboxylesterase
VARETFRVAVPGGQLYGWAEGDGEPVLVLHGGPGLSYSYLDPATSEFLPGYRVAAYQQRGLAPSTAEGPYNVAQEVADAVAVLDALAWQRAWVVGHSWGAHLLLHLAVAAPERIHAGLAVDPLGGIGDGGAAAFDAEIFARTPPAARQQAKEMDARALRGEATDGDMVESLRLVWPAYFADRDRAPAMPEMRVSVPAYSEIFKSVESELPRLSQLLPHVHVPFGFLAGAVSPMPFADAAAATAAVMPRAWLEVVEGAGHFPWYERPGCLRAALDRLVKENSL